MLIYKSHMIIKNNKILLLCNATEVTPSIVVLK